MPFNVDLLPPFDMPSEEIDGVRHYITPNGDRYKSVTTVLGEKMDHSWLDAWKAQVGAGEAKKISNQAKARGNVLHKAYENLLMNKQDPAKHLMPNYYPSYRKMKAVLEKNITKVRAIEYPLWSDILKTAGRTDLFAEWNHVDAICDHKGANKPKEVSDILSYFLQATTYKIMLKERTGIDCKKIVIMISVDFDDPQVFEENPDKFEEQVRDIFIGKDLTNFFS